MSRPSFNSIAAALTAAAVTTAAMGGSRAAEPPRGIEQLISQGWEIAGYAALALENRSFILFRHKDMKHLVQCSVRYDVTRKPSVITNCYELR